MSSRPALRRRDLKPAQELRTRSCLPTAATVLHQGFVATAGASACAGQINDGPTPDESRPSPKNKKAPTLRYGALQRWPVLQPASTCSELLGCGSGSCSSGGSVSSSLGSVSSCVGSSGCSLGSGWSGFGSRSHWCWSRSFHRSWCWSRSGFFLLAASGEGCSSDQGGQNEGVLHWIFLVGQSILKSHGVRLLEAAVRVGTMHLACTFLAQPPIILVFSQY